MKNRLGIPVIVSHRQKFECDIETHTPVENRQLNCRMDTLSSMSMFFMPTNLENAVHHDDQRTKNFWGFHFRPDVKTTRNQYFVCCNTWATILLTNEYTPRNRFAFSLRQ
jgi:hypothetical protein